MPVLQSDIDSLNRAIAAGVRSVTIGGQTVVYGTPESLIKARDDMQKQLSAQLAQNKPARRHKQTVLFQADRGY